MDKNESLSLFPSVGCTCVCCPCVAPLQTTPCACSPCCRYDVYSGVLASYALLARDSGLPQASASSNYFGALGFMLYYPVYSDLDEEQAQLAALQVSATPPAQQAQRANWLAGQHGI